MPEAEPRMLRLANIAVRAQAAANVVLMDGVPVPAAVVETDAPQRATAIVSSSLEG